jgi:hypothetical protein
MRDIFISYSHKDNLTFGADQLGWVESFHRAVRVRLTQLLGRESNVYYDEAVMSGSDVLTPAITKEVRDTKILVSVVSPSYLRSTWCNDELEYFARSVEAHGGLLLDTKSRIVKVIKLPVEPTLEKHAKVDLSDVIGYKFYRQDKAGALELDITADPSSRLEFIKNVNALAYSIRDMLERMDGEGDAPADPVPESGKVAYVAETTSDLADEETKLRRALEQYGHTVLPATPHAYAHGYAEYAGADLARADLAVHLIGSPYGTVPERERRSVVELQYDLSAEEVRRRPELKRLVWAPAETVADDERQSAFLERLRDDATLVVSSFEKLKDAAQAALAPHEAAAATAPEPAPPDERGGAKIYLIFDASDKDAVKPLDDWLFDNGFDVLRPIFAADESQIRKYDQRCLVECDAALVYCGAAPADWLLQRVMDLQKAFAYGRRAPFLARGVMMGPLQNEDKDRFRARSVVKMEMYAGFSGEALAPFLSAIRQAEAQAG